MISSSFWVVECDPFLCIITPQALESSKRSQDHRGNSTHTHTQAPASALTSLSNDVLVKRKPLGPPLCLFFSLQKPIKAKELRKLFMSIKNWQLSLMLLQNKAFLLLQRSPCWSQSHKKVPPFSPDFYGTNYVLSNLFCKW